MGERLKLRKRGKYQPDDVTQEQVDHINAMFESLDALNDRLLQENINTHIAAYGEISPETVEAMKKYGEALNQQSREVIRSGFYWLGMTRLQGMIRNPNMSPTHTLRALELGFKVNGMIPKAPLIAVQANVTNNYESMLAEAKRLELAQSNGNGTDQSGNS